MVSSSYWVVGGKLESRIAICSRFPVLEVFEFSKIPCEFAEDRTKHNAGFCSELGQNGEVWKSESGVIVPFGNLRILRF